MSGHPKTLSGQVLSATAWNALLLPARFLVALVASVVYYRVLSLEQVGLLFLITSLAATLGFNADLGIERALPRFLPEVEQRSGRDGVRTLIRRVIRAKLLIVGVFALALTAFQRPLCGFVATTERAAAAALDARAASASSDPAAAAEAAGLRSQSQAKQRLAEQIEPTRAGRGGTASHSIARSASPSPTGSTSSRRTSPRRPARRPRSPAAAPGSSDAGKPAPPHSAARSTQAATSGRPTRRRSSARTCAARR